MEVLYMQQLKDRIVSEGRVLPGNIVKIDGFLNHRVDMALMKDMAYEFERLFDISDITAVLTVEASGIPVAAMCAAEWKVPLLFAKKAKSDNIEGGLYKSDIYSYTYRKNVTLLMSAQWLSSDDRVLIVDDFLANGEALRGLVDIVNQAGAELIGIGIAVEKGFQPGGQMMRDAGHNLISLAIIDKLEENNITFRE